MQIPHCVRPRLKQSVLINISCIENLLVGKRVETFLHLPEEALVFVFADSWTCDVILWATILGGKKGDKTSCNNRLKSEKKEPASFCLELVSKSQRTWPNVLQVQKDRDPQTVWHGCAHLSPFHKPSFMYVLLGTICPPSMLRSHSADRRSG